MILRILCFRYYLSKNVKEVLPLIRKMKPTDAAALTIINKEQLGYEVPLT